MPVNMTSIPDVVATTLGIDSLTAGILVSVFLTMCILLALAYLGAGTLGTAIGGIGMIILFTALTWVPIWITVVIAMVTAVLVAGSVSGRRSAEGAG